MARRKKEPEGFHRRQIAAAAEHLFCTRGVDGATMDDIAESAGYSKATLYAYFKNKQEIVSELALQSMELLSEHLEAALAAPLGTCEKYDALCRELVDFHDRSPAYFQRVLGPLNVDLDSPDCPPADRKTFEVGERINGQIAGMLREGMETGALRPGLDILQTTFAFWAALSGIIQLSANKKAYLETVLKLSREQFLSHSFRLFYRSIERSNP